MQELRDKTPFRCTITGPTNCGKTKYLLDQLRRPFKGVFDYIVLIYPTYVKNKTYHQFAKGKKRFFVLSPDARDSDEINDLLNHYITLFCGTNTLLILDDCAVSKKLKKLSNQFIDLAFSGRHEGLSVWVLTQQLTSIAKPFRENVACVISFHNPSQITTKTLFEDYGEGIDVETRNRLVHLLKTERYSRLCFRLCYPFHYYLEIPSSLS